MIIINPPIRPCDCENIADFSRYYRFAWVAWHMHPEGPQPVNIQQTGDNSIFATDLTGNLHVIPWQRRAELSFAMPELGMVNGDYTIIYMYKTSPRQPHRGYRTQEILHTVFNAWNLRKLSPIPDPGNRTVIRNLFFPRYYELKEGLAALDTGERVGCALNERIGIYTSAADRFPMLAYRRSTIGYIENNRAMIPRAYAEDAPIIHKRLGIEVSIL
jgi:hypothetical protein